MQKHIRRRVTVLATVVAMVAGAVGASVPAFAQSAAPAAGNYHQTYRPQEHFSLPSGWMGDPNGLVYDKGEYYLFSFGTWQGAESRDLVHWKSFPVTGPAPDPDSSAFYSGSAVVDTRNTSGFGRPGHPAMVAVYTSVQSGTNIESQSIAYSTDHGRTWTRYSGNPIININSVNFRDPKVFWYAPKHEWMMVVALSDQHKVAFYTSPDLKTWKQVGNFGPAGATTGVWEMPDLYALPVSGKHGRHEQHWVLSVSVGSTGVQYFTGRFTGTAFVPDGPATYTPPAGTGIEDFEAGSYDGWATTGTAFGAAPATGALANQQTVTRYHGKYLVNSYNGGDTSTGTLTSPAFTIDKSHLNFLVGGGDNPYQAGTVPFGTLPEGTVYTDFAGDAYDAGWTTSGSFVGTGPSHETLGNQVSPGVLDTWGPDGDPGEGTITSPTFTIDSPYIDLQVAGGTHPMSQPNPTAVNLVIDGKVADTATGNNTGTLDWTNWDMADYQGQKAQIQIVDQNDGTQGWGHIMVGDIVFATQKASPWDTETSVNLLVDGKVVRSATGADSEDLDWTSWDLSALRGDTAQIQIVDNATGSWGHILADDFAQSDQPALNQIQRAHWLDYGADYYAENTWNDVPGGKRYSIAWMNNWAYAANIPTAPWQGAETMPRQVTLHKDAHGYTLEQEPVRASATLRTGRATTIRKTRVDSSTRTLNTSGTNLEIDATLKAGDAGTFGIDLREGDGHYTRLGYDTSTGELFIDRSHTGGLNVAPAFTAASRNTAPLALDHGRVSVRILLDSSSVEVLADNGRVALTDQIFPDPADTGIRAFATGGHAEILSGRIWHLGSIWKR